MRAAIAACSAVVASGCGLGWVGTNEDPTEGLPTSGAGPYGRLEVDDLTPALEPQVVTERLANLSGPSVLAGEGERLRIWFTRQADGDTATTIQYAEVPSPHEMPDLVAQLALAADQPWEGGSVAAPHVFAAGDALIMYYQGGAPTGPTAIGIARSDDDGATWQKLGPVLGDAAAPTVVEVYGQTWLFVTRAGMDGIWRAVDSGAGFTLDAAPVIAPRPTLEGAFDAVTVGDPFALATPTFDPAVVRIGLWFTGTVADPPDASAVGYAASFDGVAWERYGAERPQLFAPATGPTVLLSSSRALMLFAESDRSHLAITAAEHP